MGLGLYAAQQLSAQYYTIRESLTTGWSLQLQGLAEYEIGIGTAVYEFE